MPPASGSLRRRRCRSAAKPIKRRSAGCSTRPSILTSPRSSTGRSSTTRRAPASSACRSGISRCRPEGKARLRMLSYARSCLDPEMSKTVALNGWEEGRHKEVLSNLVETYGIKLEPEPDYVEPRDPEWAYLVTGYSECVDSFFAFGLFELAQALRHLPAGAGGYLRAGDPGRGAAYPAVPELGRLAPPDHAVVQAHLVRDAGARRLGLPRLRARRHRARHG